MSASTINVSPEYIAQSEQLKGMGIEVRPSNMVGANISTVALTFTFDNRQRGSGLTKDKFMIDAAKTIFHDPHDEKKDRTMWRIGISRFSNNESILIDVDQELFDQIRPDNKEPQKFYDKFRPMTSLSLILTKIGTETAENKLTDLLESEKAKKREISLTCMELLLQLLQSATKS